MKKYIKYIVIAILLIAAAVGYSTYSKKKKAPDWRMDKASIGSVREVVTATGSLNPYLLVDVGTEVSGKIEKLYKDYNQTVKKGELLAKLDTEILASTLEASRGDLNKAISAMEEAKLDYDLLTELYEKDMSPEYEMLKAEFKYQNAQQTVANARLSLQRAQKNLDNAYITSPIDGIIVSRNIDEGQTVAASLNSPTLFLIANDLSRMQIDASVDEADIGKIKEGMPVEFSVDAHPSQSFTGNVQQIRLNPTTESNVVSYSVIIDALNPERKLLPGMTTNVTFIIQAKEGVMRIPETASRFRPSKEVWELFGLKWDDELLNVSARLRQEKMAKAQAAAPAADATPPAQAAGMAAARGSGAGSGRGGAAGGGGGGNQTRQAAAGRSAVVWVLKGEKPEPVLVTTGVSDGAYVELIEGISETDVLITGVVYKDSKQNTNSSAMGPGMRRF